MQLNIELCLHSINSIGICIYVCENNLETMSAFTCIKRVKLITHVRIYKSKV